MPELRQRKLKEEPSSLPVNVRTRGIAKQPRRLKKVFITLILLALCATYFLGLFAGQTQWFDGLAKSLGYESVHHHAVIIDAGSSGSRVLAYKFRVPFTVFGPANLDLVEEFFAQSKPGLSSFANDPAKGADTIVQLIQKAEFLTPPEKRKDTPLIVRATAGLRLLPQEKANELIRHVAIAVSHLGYAVGTNSVEIMEGSDEGIFIWYTVNLLHYLIGGDTMAALDLGGGSTQITFELNEQETKDYPISDQYVVPAGENITLYTHSYLNLGLLAARYGIFRMEAQDNTTNKFHSVCVDPIIVDEPWTYANKEYIVSGVERKGMKRVEVYNRCHSLIRRYVMSTLDWEPKMPPRGTVAAMSYFYDVAADAGLIDVMKGGTVSVDRYRATAYRACSASNVEQPWACIDLVYMVSLLQDAYKLNDRDPISLFKKIDGHEVSWALGLAYTTVMNRIAAVTG
ncbi:ectonucleoside triphosphate diphosphohydrolase 5-like isoform X2 [Hyposmocoma kahamanoa]|uniref:ectonucleoside triphosphate diphosphohydrolase 5-like isoform X2 n=1 Tax=Hyposmocoma kahamanoa TaxID=1477025 RepID=UPI000E6D916B|nr:ectonucleoside triphosphate diphosphohydrolase 5-like isoform X2 [Hyposmocoma kahamanoa]